MDSEHKFEILVVEDTPASLKLVCDTLKAEGYLVRPANSGELALASVEAKIPELILLDIRMPGMNGFEVCEQLKSDPRTQSVPVIFLSAFTETEQHVKGFELGAVDFITKPFERAELLARVKTHLELNYLRNSLEDEVLSKTTELQQSNQRLESSYKQLQVALDGIISATGKLLAMRDPYTSNHQKNVAKLSSAIAEEMGVSEERVRGIHMGALIHDIGKISIAAEILVKPGKLTDIEYAIIKGHAESGFEVLKDIAFPWPIAQIAHQHHERMDGSGYPEGLKGDQIIAEAKIVAVADVVEAMSADRPYRSGLGTEMALEEIRKNRGLLYDEAAVDACLALFEEERFSFDVPPGTGEYK